MNLDRFEWTLGALLASMFVCVVAMVSGAVGVSAWRASEKAAAYKAYTDCLHEMKQQPIDVQQTFCGKIKDQL